MNAPKDGIYYDVPEFEYRAWNAFSYSMTQPILKSPAHLRAYFQSDIGSRPAVVLGRLIDSLLTGTSLNSFGVLPETKINSKGEVVPFDLKDKESKSIHQGIVDSGKTPIKKKEFDLAQSIVNNIQKSKTATGLLKGCCYQVAIVWTEETTGLKCKGLLDAYIPEMFSIVDLKSTTDATPDKWCRHIYDMGYYIQAGAYTLGIEAITKSICNFYHIVVETESPFGCATYCLREDTIMTGRAKFLEGLRAWGKIKDIPQEEWGCYPDSIIDIDIKPYNLLSQLELQMMYENRI